MVRVAKVLSIIFHPLLIPTFGFLILFNSGTYLSFLDFEFKRMIFFLVVLSTLIIPLLLTLFLYYQKLLYSFNLSERRERYIPLIIVLVFYVFCYILLKRAPVPHHYHAFCFATVITTLLTLAVTLKWKVSFHMIGLGGLTGMIVFLIFSMRINLEFYLILAIIATGISGTSRLILDAHKPSQLYAGFILGLVTVPSVMWIY